MKYFIEKSMNAVRHYDIVDFSIFKICLVSTGILFGACFSSFFNKKVIKVLLLLTTVISLLAVLYKTFFIDYEEA